MPLGYHSKRLGQRINVPIHGRCGERRSPKFNRTLPRILLVKGGGGGSADIAEDISKSVIVTLLDLWRGGGGGTVPPDPR